LKRPISRNECIDGLRPCPWVGCKYHLYIDVNPNTGRIKWNHDKRAAGHKCIVPQETILKLLDQVFLDAPPSCALDMVEEGGMTLEEVGATMNLTRERIRQIEAVALKKIRAQSKTLLPYVTGDEE